MENHISELKKDDYKLYIENPKKNSNSFREIKKFLMKDVNVMDELNIKLILKERNNKPNTISLYDYINTKDKLLDIREPLPKPHIDKIKLALNLLN